ncbi:MAG: glycosyltransferase family 9 protein [Gammaproteobacteria bacterium]
MPNTDPPKILVVRRDNIGDLICTTPLLHAIRLRYPSAYVAVLVSSYNVEVLHGNPDIDETFIFLKRQQRSHGHNQLATLWKRWLLLRTLRQRCFDYVVLANGGWRYCKKIHGRHMIGFRERDNPDHRQPDIVVPLANSTELHEVEKMARLGEALDVTNALGPTRLFPDMNLVSALRARLGLTADAGTLPVVGIHISSRRPQQRWPIANFAALMRRIHAAQTVRFVLFWSPGRADDPMHPGDDEKADALLREVADLPVTACPALTISELIAGMACIDSLICSDGGAMHVAAAFGKPIVCFFGHSIAAEWHPWGVPYVLLQPETRHVDDISVNEALAGYGRLLQQTGQRQNT